MRDRADIGRNGGAVWRILAAETAITVTLALGLYIAVDGLTGVSALLGGGAFVLPNALSARLAFRYSAADSAVLAMRWLCIGEAVKLMATGTIFAACFLFLAQVNVPVLFACYAGLLLLNLVFLAGMKTR